MDLNQDFVDAVSSNYPNAALIDLYRKYFRKLEPKISENYSFYDEVNNTKTDKLTREYLLKLLTLIFFDKYLFNQFLDILPPIIKNIFEEVIYDDEPISQEQMSQMLGEDVFFFVKTDSSDFSIIRSMLVVKLKLGHYSVELPEVIRNILKNHIPESTKIKVEIKSKEIVIIEDKLLINRDEDDLLDNVHDYYFYLSKNKLSLDTNEKIQKPLINDIKNYFEIDEFFQDSNKKLDSIKTELIFNFLIYLGDNIRSDQSPLGVFKHLFKNYLSPKSKFSSYSLLTHLNLSPHFSSFERNKEKNDSFHLAMFILLKSLSLEEWVSFDSLFEYAELNQLNVDILSQREAKSLYFINNGEKIYLKSSESFKEGLVKPIIKASLFLFSAFGLIDIAYEDPTKAIFYPYQTLKYVKLTKLGNFIIDGQKDYTYKSEKPKFDIFLDPDSLIMRFSIKHARMSDSMTSFAEKINKKTFRVTYKSFLSSCTTNQSIIEKIDLLKTVLHQGINPLWQRFFDDIVLKSDFIRINNNIVTFDITKDYELATLIAKDEILKKYVLKVENFKISVDQKNLKVVSERLLEFGFLI